MGADGAPPVRVTPNRSGPARRSAGLLVRRRWLGLAALGVAVATCRDAPLFGPGRGGVAQLAFQPVLAPGVELATFGITIDSLRVVVIRPATDTLEDTTVFVHPDSAAVQLAVTVLMQQPAETLVVAFEFSGAGIVLFAGADTTEIVAGPPGTNPPITDTLAFVGPGNGLTNLDVLPADSVLALGGSLRFRVIADQGGVPLTQFFVAWTTSDTLVAQINHAGVLTAPPTRNRVYVKVRAPNGVMDSTPVTFVPPATTIAQAGGNGQSGTVGTALAQPIRVRVTAGDALGVKGTPVTFAITGGGGSVAQSAAVTDDTGFAQTSWTLGPSTIGQTATATATGLSGSPVGFTATALAGPASQLVFTVQPATTPLGTTIAPAVEVTARDAGGNTVTGFTGDVSIAIGTNPGGGSLAGTATQTAVNGVATFPDLSINNPGTGYTLVASAGVLTGTSGPFDILPPFGGRFWLNAAGGNWSNPANWSGGVAPGLTDTVFITLDGTYTVTLDVSDTVAFLFLGGETGTQTLAATNLTFRVDSAASILPSGELSFVNVTLEGSATGTGVLNQGTLQLQSGSFAPALANSGLAVLRGTMTLSGTVTTTPGSVTRLEADAFCCTAAVTAATGFFNAGTVELTAVNATGTTAQLTVTNGALVNAPGGLISILPGTGGARTLTAQLDNQGTLSVDQPLTLGQASASHTNSGTVALTGGDLTLTQSGTSPSFTTAGTIAIASGFTFQVNSGAFNYAGGEIGGLGTLAFSGATAALTPDLTNDTLALSFLNSTVDGPGTLGNAVGRTLVVQTSTLNAPLANQGVVTLRGTTALNGSVTTTGGSTLRLEADAFCCTATVTVATGFTNLGTIELTAVNAGGTTAQLTVTSGTLVNAPTGQINILAGAGGARTLSAALDNQGTLTVAHALTLSKASAAHQNSGTIAVTGGDLTLTQSGTSPSFTTSGTIAIASGFTISVNSGTFNYAGGTIGGLGTLAFSGATAALTPDLTNDTLALSFLNSTVDGPGTLGNAVGRTLVVQTSTLNAPLANQGVVTLRGTTALNGVVTTTGGSTLRLEADAFCCTATVTVATGFTNLGTIELTAVNATGTTAQLTVTSGTLVNAPTGQINVLAGAGGARTLTAQLDNRGTLTVGHLLTITMASAAHQNSGTIAVTGGDLTLTQSGTSPSFTTSGTIAIASGFTFNVNSGTFNYAGGAIGGQGLLAFSGATATLTPDLTNDTLTLSFLNGTVNGPGTLGNAVGRTLVVQTSTLNAPFANQGVATLRGTTALNGSVTTTAGSTLRLEGDAFCCTATVMVANGFTNLGTIELTAVNAGGTTAQLTVTSGTLVNGPTGQIDVLTGAGGARTLTAELDNQGKMLVGEALAINRSSSTHTNSGTIDLAAGTTLSVTGTGTSLTNAPSGTIGGSGGLNVSTVAFTNDGGIVPGTSAGLLQVTGAVPMSATAVLNIELGGLAAGTLHDQLAVSGAATLGGTLNVTLIGGFTPSIGNTFTILTAGSLTGTFAAAQNLPTLPIGSAWQVIYGSTEVMLTVVASSQAPVVSWINALGGNWSVGTNWSTGTVPTPADSVEVTLPGTYTVTVDVPATVAFVNVGGASGTQTLAIAGQTLTLGNGGAVNAATGVLNLSSGTLTGGGTLTVDGSMNWTGGTMTGAGVTRIGTGGVLNVGGAGTKTFTTRTLVNAGQVVWTAGQINSGLGAVLQNQAGATFDVRANLGWLYNQGGSLPRLSNLAGAVVQRTVGTGTATLDVIVDNAGTLDVQSGTLLLSNGGTSGGTFTAGTGTTLEFGSGTQMLSGTSSVTGTGTVAFSSGTTTLGGAYDVTGTTAISSGVVNFNTPSPAQTTGLTLSGGSLTGLGEVQLRSNGSWTAGTLTGTGVLRVLAGATWTITGTATKVLTTRTLVNMGQVVWTGGQINSGLGAVLQNQAGATFDVQVNLGWFYNQGGSLPRLSNLAGAVVKRTVGTGTATLDVIVDNAGSLDVQSGTLLLSNGGTSGGTFTAGTGTTLTFGAGTHNLGATSSVAGAGTIGFSSGATTLGGAYDVTGTTAISSGVVNVNTPSPAQTTGLTLSGGSLDGTGEVQVRTSGNWSGGTLTGTGVLRVLAGATLSLTGAGTKIFTTRTLVNVGQVVWTGGQINSGLGAVLQNQAGATFDVQPNLGWFYNQGGSLPRLSNLAGAAVKRTVGTGTATLDVLVDNAGSLDVQAGTLLLSNGGTSGGTFTAGPGGTLAFGFGTHSLVATSSVTGAGTVAFSAATATVAGTYDVTGTTVVSAGSVDFNTPSPAQTTGLSLSGGTLTGTREVQLRTTGSWTAGTLTGTGILRVLAGATLSLTGAGTKIFTTRTLVNAGQVVWTGGQINSGLGAVLENQAGGTFDVQVNLGWLYNQGGSLPRLSNLAGAAVKRTTGTGTATLDVIVDNGGSLDVQSGTLLLSNGGTSGGTFTTGSGGALDFGAAHTLGATSRVSGPGLVNFSSGAVNIGGTDANAYDVTGTTQIVGGTVTFNTTDSARITTLQLRGGLMQGSAPMVVRSAGFWTGGTLSGPAGSILRIPPGATLSIGGAATKFFTARTILNLGTVNWTASTINASNGATWDNQPDAVFNVSAAASWAGSGTPVPRIENRSRGAIKVTTAGTTSIGPSVEFNNTGTLDIQAGATLKVSGDFHNLTNGGELLGTGVLDVSGSSKVSNTGIVRPGTSTGILTIAGPSAGWPQQSGSTVVAEVFGLTEGTLHDQLKVTGAISIGTGAALQVIGNDVFVPKVGEFVIVVASPACTGQFTLTYSGIQQAREAKCTPAGFVLTW